MSELDIRYLVLGEGDGAFWTRRGALALFRPTLYPLLVAVLPQLRDDGRRLRPGSVRFSEDGGNLLRGVVEHMERLGEHHAGDAVGVANVR